MRVLQFNIQSVEMQDHRARAVVWVCHEELDTAEHRAREHLKALGWLVEKAMMSLVATPSEVRKLEPAARQAYRAALSSGICAVIHWQHA